MSSARFLLFLPTAPTAAARCDDVVQSKHMRAALDAAAGVDTESKELLVAYFSHMAYFLVAGKEMTNPSNLVDYHNKMSESSRKS